MFFSALRAGHGSSPANVFHCPLGWSGLPPGLPTLEDRTIQMTLGVFADSCSRPFSNRPRTIQDIFPWCARWLIEGCR